MQILVTEKPLGVAMCPFSRGPFSDCDYHCSIDPSYVCKSPLVCPYLKECKTSEEHTRITPNEYQEQALRTQNPLVMEDLRIVEGVMGLAGEAGECVDIIKKKVFQGHELDKEHLAKELGDVAWYLAESADAIGYDLETIFRKNLDKLKNRYPDGFDSERSYRRDPDDI